MPCLDKLINQATKHQKKHQQSQSYIGRKNIDDQIFSKVLEVAKQQNWYTNFGPVSQLLENYIAQDLNLPDHRKVIMAANGTAAMMALLGLYDVVYQRKTRWLVSSYGFFTTNIGLLHQAKILDCDSQGMLSFSMLEQQDLASYDGVILTNVFGVAGDVSCYQKFCRQHHKILIADNAAAYYTPGRDNAVDEIISFHHTKPAGFGEGGCLIIDKKNEAIARALLNFGVGLDVASYDYRYLAQNGKISDIASAYILQQLTQLPTLKQAYQAQYIRIAAIAKQLGFAVMQEILDKNIGLYLPSSVSVVLNKKISMKTLAEINQHFVMRKYYKPLLSELSNCPMAEKLYKHNVCLPCHPDMSAVSDEEIIATLLELKK